MRPTLVLLPGSLCDRWMWSQQSAAISDLCEAVVPHFLEANSLEHMARAVLEQVSGEFALCGHAMGGRVALEVLRLEPQRVLALALLATTVHPVREGEGARRQTQIDLAVREGMAALAAAWLPKVLHPRGLQNTQLMRGLTDMYCRFTPEDYRREVRTLLDRPDPRPLLAQIACPTLVLSGRQDPLCTPEQAQSLAAQIQQAELAILEECAHFPPLEQPEQVTRALIRWLRRAGVVIPEGAAQDHE